jgi:hypothetical protein
MYDCPSVLRTWLIMLWTSKRREAFRALLISEQDFPWSNWVSYHDEIRLSGIEDFRSGANALARLPGFEISGMKFFRSIDSPYWSWVQIVRFHTVKNAELNFGQKLFASVRMNPSATLLESTPLLIDPIFPHSKSMGFHRRLDTLDGLASEKLYCLLLGHFFVCTQLVHVGGSEPTNDDLIRIASIQGTRIVELAWESFGEG